MPKQYQKNPKAWSEDDMEKALALVRCGASVNSTAKKYGMDEKTLRYRIKKINDGHILTGSGRKPIFDNDTETLLAHCIDTLCKIGFSPTMNEILDLVAEYIAVNNLRIPMFASGRPGKHWFRAFMKRNKLSLKKANMISAARKSATGTPFIIHDFYDQLKKVITDKNFEAKHIWNCDEMTQLRARW